MTRQDLRKRPRLGPLALAIVSSWAWSARSEAQQAPAPSATPPATASPPSYDRPMTALPDGPPAASGPVLPPDVQVVRFTAPEGAKIEILGPAPEPVVAGEAAPSPSSLTVGLKVGTGYRLKLSNLPDAPGAELFPVVELVGHLHRPAGIDPLKYPIRIPFGEDDTTDAAVRGRLVTQVVYLEAPEQAIPVSYPRDQIPVVTLSPVESPMKVAPALGRVVAIVRTGGRAPTFGELDGRGDYPFTGAACPFSNTDGSKCSQPCGPVRGTPPPPGRPWIPVDEFLCDGGDGLPAAGFGGDGGLRGVDPRDAVIRFRADNRPRVLPTNRVCLYAPRFAAVRSSVGINQGVEVVNLVEHDRVQRQEGLAVRQGPKRFILNQSPELARHRSRASLFKGRVYAADHVELRVLQGYDVPTNIAGHVLVQPAALDKGVEVIRQARIKLKPEGIKTAETAVVTGLAAGAGQNVMSWSPQEVASVEVPPNKPGLAVIKQVSASEAEPGDEVTYTIRYRNIGNVPITGVSVVDNLLARLEYIPRSALGPPGTVFTANENAVGSTELRWDLPEAVAPGQEGYVLFRARVR